MCAYQYTAADGTTVWQRLDRANGLSPAAGEVAVNWHHTFTQHAAAGQASSHTSTCFNTLYQRQLTYLNDSDKGAMGVRMLQGTEGAIMGPPADML